jgi:hypothetical protein
MSVMTRSCRFGILGRMKPGFDLVSMWRSEKSSGGVKCLLFRCFWIFSQDIRFAISQTQQETPPNARFSHPSADLKASLRSQFSSCQPMMSQLSIPSRMISLWRSICQFEYRCLALPAAFRCAGPTPPFIASSRDLQTQVARFRPSASGSPNQYLSSLSAVSFIDYTS